MKYMIEKKLLRDQKERSVLFVGFLVIVGTAVMLIPWYFIFNRNTRHYSIERSLSVKKSPIIEMVEASLSKLDDKGVFTIVNVQKVERKVCLLYTSPSPRD